MEDPPIHGQEWICVSFLSPEGISNCKLRGLKFRGAFGTKLEAKEHAKEIQDKLQDVHSLTNLLIEGLRNGKLEK